ncbi:hypothetical protein IWZ00DRAFT_497883 [Phyllosticta capitalensis]
MTCVICFLSSLTAVSGFADNDRVSVRSRLSRRPHCSSIYGVAANADSRLWTPSRSPLASKRATAALPRRVSHDGSAAQMPFY